MTSSAISDLPDILRCPRCRAPITCEAGTWACSGEGCSLARFPSIDGQPLLIDPAKSIIPLEALTERHVQTSSKAGRRLTHLKSAFRRARRGTNLAAKRAVPRFLALARSGRRPRILIVGGGTVGSGAGALYEAQDVDLIGTDVFPSPATSLAADAHDLPFADGSFDGVWIQAVLEHVVDPARVASEVARVLKARGVVYADTAFMQPVHEGQFDFQRFSCNAHRLLFAAFDEVDSGAVQGAGVALAWSAQHFVYSLTRSRVAGAFVGAALFWLRYLDRLADPEISLDGASGTYFLGLKKT